jgi:hypothetical protein
MADSAHQVIGSLPTSKLRPAIAKLVAPARAFLLIALFLSLAGTAARSETAPDELAKLHEGREICFDEWGLIVRNSSPVCENTAAVHKLDDGSDTALLEGWYWLGVWLRNNTPGLEPWEQKRKLSFDDVLRFLDPNQDGVIRRHPYQARWSDAWSEDVGTSRDQLIPLIAAMGVWGKHAELRRLWNALPEDLLGKHAFNGEWLNVLGQPGSNCAELRAIECRVGDGCSAPDQTVSDAKYQACQAANIFSGDLLGPDIVNLFLRATNVNPLTVLPGNTPVQGGMVGEQQLLIKTYSRIAEASFAGEGAQQDKDTVDADLNLIVQLLIAKLRFANQMSEAAALQYARHRPSSYGSWLGAYYKAYGSDVGDDEIRSRIDSGIEGGWVTDVSVVNGVLRWYHRTGLGGNPQLASLYEPIIDRYLVGVPSPLATSDPTLTGSRVDELTLIENRAADFASFYWIHVANENEDAIKYLSETYADVVNYYGKRVSKGEIIADKRRFVKRWPERNYQPRWIDTKINCHAKSQECTIEGVADFEANNPTRGKSESGTFRYSMKIRLVADRINIVAESSEVIGRAR